jgi:hypothetical protein
MHLPNLEAINTPTRGFPRRFALHTLSFNFLDDRTIGCKNDETRVHAPVMRMPLLISHERGGSAMATALMDAHDDGLKF